MNSAAWRTQATTSSPTPRLLGEVRTAANRLTLGEASLPVIPALEAITVTGHMTQHTTTSAFLDSQGTIQLDNPMGMYPGPKRTTYPYPSQPPAGTSLSITQESRRFNSVDFSDAKRLSLVDR